MIRFLHAAVTAAALLAAVGPAWAERAVAERVLTLVNAAREAGGAPPLAADPRLAAAAQAHAEDMARRGYFDHVSPEGQELASRVLTAGYAYSRVAENIAAGTRTPDATVESWLSSPSHRRNLLGLDYRDMGVGFVTVPDDAAGRYRTYWSVVLGTAW